MASYAGCCTQFHASASLPLPVLRERNPPAHPRNTWAPCTDVIPTFAQSSNSLRRIVQHLRISSRHVEQHIGIADHMVNHNIGRLPVTSATAPGQVIGMAP